MSTDDMTFRDTGAGRKPRKPRKKAEQPAASADSVSHALHPPSPHVFEYRLPQDLQPEGVPAAQASGVSGGFAIRSIAIDETRYWSGTCDIVFQEEAEEYAVQLQQEREAHKSAEAIMRRAKSEADRIVSRAHQQARALGDTQLKLWQEAFDARQQELSDSLGQAVAVVVESVLKNLLGANVELPVQVSIELALRVLNAELRASALCHPLDLPLVQAQTGKLGTTGLKVDESLPRGQIAFSGDEGEVRVDGQRVLDRLLNELRQVLATKAPTASA